MLIVTLSLVRVISMETYPLPERPEEAINQLIDTLKISGELRRFASGAHIPVQPDHIIVIEQGALSMHRMMDGLMMIESTRPQLLGITYNNQFSHHFTIKAESVCEARMVPVAILKPLLRRASSGANCCWSSPGTTMCFTGRVTTILGGNPIRLFATA